MSRDYHYKLGYFWILIFAAPVAFGVGVASLAGNDDFSLVGVEFRGAAARMMGALAMGSAVAIVVFAVRVVLPSGPAVRVSDEGVWVRGVLGSRSIPWDELNEITLTSGPRFRRMDLASDRHVLRVHEQVLAEPMQELHDAIIAGRERYR